MSVGIILVHFSRAPTNSRSQKHGCLYMYICSLLKAEMNIKKGFQIVFKNKRLINSSSYFLGRLVRSATLTILSCFSCGNLGLSCVSSF